MKYCAFLFALALLFPSCWSDEAPAESNPPAEDKPGEDVQPLEPVELDVLKAVLPKRLLGMERIEYSANKTGAFGFNVSVVTATYEEDDARLDIVITDAGRFTQVISGIATWTKMEVDKENESGFERTTTIEGYKAFEKYNRDRRSGELSLIVDNRFVVAIDGEGVDERDFRRIVRRLDLEDLERR